MTFQEVDILLMEDGCMLERCTYARGIVSVHVILGFKTFLSLSRPRSQSLIAPSSITKSQTEPPKKEM